MSIKKTPTQKLNRYQKIMARADKKRPMSVKEIGTTLFKCEEGLVLNIKVLTPHGSTIAYSWSEKDLDSQ